jgi:hypothetical protein
MGSHEFIVKTLEVDWLAPMFTGVRLSGLFVLDVGGTQRLDGTAVVSTKGNAEPASDTTNAVFQGGSRGRLDIKLSHSSDLGIFRVVMFNDWNKLSVLFESDAINASSSDEQTVVFKSFRVHRDFG